MKNIKRLIMLTVIFAGVFISNPLFASTEPLEYVKQMVVVEGEKRIVTIPKGYQLEILTDRLDEPRLLTFHSNGDLFSGSKSGNVYRFAPPYTKAEVLVELDDYPHSVAFRSGEIFIAQNRGLYRAPYKAGQAAVSKKSLKLIAPLPGGSGHSSRTVGVGPDGRIYLSLGITGNCSNEYLGTNYPFDKQRGGVLVLREEGGKYSWETFASGLRNPIGFDWHPVTKVLYASNNGPDHHGFEKPPEYFSHLAPGSFHGMPWFQFDGREIRRDNCIESKPPRSKDEVVKPAATFPARNAPMGVVFVSKGAMNKALENDAIVALHGSWATRPSGGFLGDPATRRPPKIVVVRFKDGTAQRVDDLITGFQLENGERWARPVGLEIGPNGALYFTSDSDANALFRLKHVVTK